MYLPFNDIDGDIHLFYFNDYIENLNCYSNEKNTHDLYNMSSIIFIHQSIYKII